MTSTTVNSDSDNNVATYKWVIGNFRSTRYKYTSAGDFSVNKKAHFTLYFNSSLTNMWGDSWSSVSLYLCTASQDKLRVKYRMSIVDAKGDKCNTQEGIAVFYKQGSFGGQYNVLRSTLLDSTNRLLVNDTLTVVCEIELLNDGQDLQAKSGSDFSTISHHFESLLESAKHSDVVLSVGDKEFGAHKSILSARSPVFAVMFDHSDTKEAQQNRVNIGNISVDVFELFLRYIYTGKIDELDRCAPELLAAADMYQMDCLKSLCERHLCTTLTIENVSQLLIHADMYRADVLKSNCADYITDNSAKVKVTDGWKAVTAKAELLKLLFDKMSTKFSYTKK